MKTPIPNAARLRIIIGEHSHHEHHPLYEAIVLKLRERGFPGATVLRGIMGFGAGNTIHTAKILQLSMDMPIVVEAIASRDQIESFLPVLETMMTSGLVTIENIEAVSYQANIK